jgi:chromosome segregation ATPase
MEIKELVKQWRSLNAQHQAMSNALELSRADFHRLDAEHSAAVTAWEGQKEAMISAIQHSRGQIDEAKKANAAIVHQADEAMQKAEERRRRNDDHKKVLAVKCEELAGLQRVADAEDQAKAERLHAFRASREHLRQQLQDVLNRLSAALPKERGEAEAKIDELAQKIAATQSRTEEEERQWQSEVAQRRAAKRRAFRVELEKEVSGAARAKRDWADMRQHVPMMTDPAVAIAEIDALRQRVREIPI